MWNRGPVHFKVKSIILVSAVEEFQNSDSNSVYQSWTQLTQLTMHACIGEGNGNPLQCSCLESPRDRGAWWAAVYGVAQSQTRLKRLSSSSGISPRWETRKQKLRHLASDGAEIWTVVCLIPEPKISTILLNYLVAVFIVISLGRQIG